MNWLERHFAIFPRPALVLVIGAGEGRELAPLTRHAETRTVLVEPQPRLADTLRRRTADRPNVEVIESALDDSDGTATLKVFNFPELSSLRPDESLTALFPGARSTVELTVETRTLGELMEQLDFPAGEETWLIVDAPDLETTVLAALEDRALRSRIRHIVLRSSRISLAGAKNGVEPLPERLLKRGYRPLGTMDTSDGDWPRVHVQYFWRSAIRRELEEEIDVLTQRSKDLEAAKSELQEQLERQRMEFQDRMSQLDEPLQGVTRDAEQRLAVLSADLEQSKQALEESKRLLECKVDELKDALDEKEGAMTQAAEAHRSEKEKLEKDLEQARSDLGVALRMQALRDADLKELQERYAEVTELKNRQHELLTQLGQRLGAASEYLSLLQGTESARQSEVATGLVEALSGDLES
jgi:FkbM family methyltransferase